MILVGGLIWVSVQPLIRLFLCVAAGFTVAKLGLLPPVAARGAGQLVLNITFPCLLFSKIVPAFSLSNLGALGPLILVALLYEAIGIAISWIVKQIFWVPHRFRYGILVAGGWGNVGDIPISVVMNIMAAAPFNGSSDQNLGVAYASVFLFVFFMTLFPLGGANWVAMDFRGPDVTDEDVQEQLKIKHSRIFATIERWLRNIVYWRRPRIGKSNHVDEEATPQRSDSPMSSAPRYEDPVSAVTTITKHTVEVAETKIEARPESESEPEPVISLRRRLARLALRFIQTCFAPCFISIVFSFIIAIVPVLKALFVHGVLGVSISPAPDGQPPLAILLNTATFIGNASVPLGLMTLSSALARMQIPSGQIRSLPLGAVCMLTAGRMIVMPVLGVLIVQGLTRIGFLNADDHVLRFVCIFMSCIPSATTQVRRPITKRVTAVISDVVAAQMLLTQVHSGTGNAQHLSVFLVPQYVLMFFVMTAVITFTLYLLSGL